MTYEAQGPTTGIVQTVTGPIPATELGPTLIHEHLVCDLTTYWLPDNAPDHAHLPLTLDTLAVVRADPFAIRDDLALDRVDQAIDELTLHRDLGGGAVVEVTSNGIGRDVRALGSSRVAAACP